MKKVLLLIALFFATVSSSFAGQYILSDSGFDENGQSIETGDAVYFSNYSGNNYTYTLYGWKYNTATSGEVFWYVNSYARSSNGSPIDNFNYVYPYIDTALTFYHIIPDVPYMGEVGVNLGVYGTDASVTINW
jgi:hypothetical protein